MHTRISLAVAAIGFCGCAASPDVQTTVDPAANLAGYRAYAFLEMDTKGVGAITDAQVEAVYAEAVAIAVKPASKATTK